MPSSGEGLGKKQSNMQLNPNSYQMVKHYIYTVPNPSFFVSHTYTFLILTILLLLKHELLMQSYSICMGQSQALIMHYHLWNPPSQAISSKLIPSRANNSNVASPFFTLFYW